MKSNEILRYFENDLTAYKMFEQYIKEGDYITGHDLLRNFNENKYENYEFMLPLLMMSADNTLVETVWQRLCLKLYNDEMEKNGMDSMTKMVMDILLNEMHKNDTQYFED